MFTNMGIHSLLSVLCARVFVPVFFRIVPELLCAEVGQKQNQLDKDRMLQAKSPTELKHAQQHKDQQDQSHQDVCVCVCVVCEFVIVRLLLNTNILIRHRLF